MKKKTNLSAKRSGDDDPFSSESNCTKLASIGVGSGSGGRTTIGVVWRFISLEIKKFGGF